MATASGLSVDVDLDRAPVPEDIATLADALEFDPWCAISEGTLLAAVRADAVEEVIVAWRQVGIDGYRLGQFTSSHTPLTVRRSGKQMEIGEPEEDPFWDLFFAGISGE